MIVFRILELISDQLESRAQFILEPFQNASEVDSIEENIVQTLRLGERYETNAADLRYWL